MIAVVFFRSEWVFGWPERTKELVQPEGRGRWNLRRGRDQVVRQLRGCVLRVPRTLRVLTCLSWVLASPLQAIPSEPPAKGPVASPAVVSITDAAGRGLGLLSIDRRASLDPSLSRTVFESPSGRILVATRRRAQGGITWTAFREAGAGETLVVWGRWDLGGDEARVPTIYIVGDSSVGWSWLRKGSNAEEKRARANLARWISVRSPSLANLLREAVEASIVSQSAVANFEGSADLQRVVVPTVSLYSVFGRPQDRSTGQTAVLRVAGRDATKRLLDALDASSVPAFAGPDTSKRWSGRVVGGREEKLGQLSLGWKALANPGAPLQASIATLDWAAGSRGERAHVMFFGPGGGYFVKLERKTGGDWTTVVTIDGFGDVEGEGWWAPYRIGDRFLKEGVYDFVEIPPSGDRDIRQARSDLLDRIRGAMGRSGFSGADAEEMLFRWQRILNLDEVRDSLPQLGPLAGVLSETPMPVFRNEADEAWAGSVELRSSDRR